MKCLKRMIVKFVGAMLLALCVMCMQDNMVFAEEYDESLKFVAEDVLTNFDFEAEFSNGRLTIMLPDAGGEKCYINVKRTRIADNFQASTSFYEAMNGERVVLDISHLIDVSGEYMISFYVEVNGVKTETQDLSYTYEKPECKVSPVTDLKWDRTRQGMYSFTLPKNGIEIRLCKYVLEYRQIGDEEFKIKEVASVDCRYFGEGIDDYTRSFFVRAMDVGNCEYRVGISLFSTDIENYAHGDCVYSDIYELSEEDAEFVIWDGVLKDYNGTSSSVSIPNRVTEIGDFTFYYNTLIEQVVISSSVTKIGEGAFAYSGITEITIPSSVTEIAADAFEGVEGLVIYSPAGSYAITYAKENGFSYVELDAGEKTVYDFVERMYTVALGREADESGCEWWTDLLLNGVHDGASISSEFLLGNEFTSKNYTNEEYVKVLYATFFDREITDGEGQFWIDSLTAGASRACVLAGFVNSTEFFNLCSEYEISRGVMLEDGTLIHSGIGRFAERLYTEVLERAGEEDGMEFWAIAIANGQCTPEDAAKSFFQCDEYVNKNTTDEDYIKALYRTFMARECDADGLAFWVGMLNDGTTRENALNGFASSEEFKNIMASYGL